MSIKGKREGRNSIVGDVVEIERRSVRNLADWADDQFREMKRIHDAVGAVFSFLVEVCGTPML